MKNINSDLNDIRLEDVKKKNSFNRGRSSPYHKTKTAHPNAEMPTSPHLGVLTYATTKIYLGDCKITN